MNIKLELEKSFINFRYDDVTHKYWNVKDSKKYISVTQFLSSLKPHFDETYWLTWVAFKEAGYKMKKLPNGFMANNNFIQPGITDISSYELRDLKDIKKDWNNLKIEGNNRGSYLHKLMENLDNRDYTFYLPLNKNENPDLFDSYEKLYSLAKSFKSNTESWLFPIAQESIIGDSEFGIAGRFDRLYYNENSGEYEIWDFKTDKKLEYSNKYGKISLFDLDDCEFEKYSLQTSLYKYIIEKNTNIKLGDSYVVWFQYKTTEYTIIKCIDYTHLIDEKLKQWQQ